MWAFALMSQGDYAGAAEKYEMAIELKPEFPEAYL